MSFTAIQDRQRRELRRIDLWSVQSCAARPLSFFIVRNRGVGTWCCRPPGLQRRAEPAPGGQSPPLEIGFSARIQRGRPEVRFTGVHRANARYDGPPACRASANSPSILPAYANFSAFATASLRKRLARKSAIPSFATSSDVKRANLQKRAKPAWVVRRKKMVELCGAICVRLHRPGAAYT